jgi:hypothetical protein
MISGATAAERAASTPGDPMPRPVCLFTGQWADLPLEKLCEKAKEFGYDGLELACWGDHFDVQRALADQSYSRSTGSS